MAEGRAAPPRQPPRTRTPVLLALALWAAWTAATYLLEGRVLTLLRPDAVGDRLRYLLVANLGIGIVGAGLVLGHLTRPGLASRRTVGFGPAWRSCVAVVIGGALGCGIYLAQGAPTLDPVVLLNGFAQVLPVSIAEVLVCWAVLGGALDTALSPRFGRWGTAVAALVAAVLFGANHYAHSPPFNTTPMVALLAGVGLATGTFFFLSRDVWGTVVFHNVLGIYGVLGALERVGGLHAYEVPQGVLLVSAAVSAAALLAVHRMLASG